MTQGAGLGMAGLCSRPGDQQAPSSSALTSGPRTVVRSLPG